MSKKKRRDAEESIEHAQANPTQARKVLNKKGRNLFIFIVIIAIALLGAGFIYLRSGFRGSNEEYMKRIVAEHKIIDVHEHIRSIEDAPKMMSAMDAVGIGKTCLMGSSLFTLTLNPSVGFTHYDENNDELLKIKEQYPGRFEAWPTMDPKDPQKLEKFQALVQRGAQGLKLYVGHGYTIKKTNKFMFHTVAIDDPQMLPVYRYCQENFIPIVVHVQLDRKLGPGFLEELVAVLMEFPSLKVVCPHFMLSSKSPKRLREMLDTFPNLYSDISFGHDDFLLSAIDRISQKPDPLREVFEDYPNRFMFSTDLVVTNEPVKTEEWIQQRFQVYVDFMTKSTYTTPLRPGQTLQGLNLPPQILDRVFYKNYEDFMALKPKTKEANKSLDWGKIGGAPLNRKPGQMFPPSAL
jgi:predicted TIM-barrel fold metal-dependent hydrolase